MARKLVGARQNKKVYIALSTNSRGNYILIPIIKPEANLKDWIYTCTEIWDLIQTCNLFEAKEKTFRREGSEKLKWIVFARDKHKCRTCKSNMFLELDHIIPISKKGKTVLENLQTLCRKCNRTKSNKLPITKAKQ